MSASVLIGIIVALESAFSGAMQLVAQAKAALSLTDQAAVNAQLATSLTNMTTAVGNLDADAAS
jgi:hypothetical protein